MDALVVRLSVFLKGIEAENEADAIPIGNIAGWTPTPLWVRGETKQRASPSCLLTRALRLAK